MSEANFVSDLREYDETYLLNCAVGKTLCYFRKLIVVFIIFAFINVTYPAVLYALKMFPCVLSVGQYGLRDHGVK